MLQAFLATMPERKDGPKLTQYLAGLSRKYNTFNNKENNFLMVLVFRFTY